VIAIQASDVVWGLLAAFNHGLAEHGQEPLDLLNEPTLFGGGHRPHKAHERGEDRAPGRQLPRLAERVDRQRLQARDDAGRQGGASRRKIGDGGGDTGRARDDIGTEHGQIEAGIREEHAVKDLQTGTEPGCFEVKFAQAPALLELVADEQLLAIEAAADRFEVWGDRQGSQPRQAAPALADLVSQGVHQGMEASGVGSSSGHERCFSQQNADPPMPAGSACTVPHLPLPAESPEIFPAPHSFNLVNGVRVVSVDQEQAPVVCLDFWCAAGSRTETAQESGIAHFLEHMVFKGSGQLAAGEFDRRIEALGGSSNAATGFDDVHYHVLIPPEAAPEALDLLLDLVLDPRLDADDFGMEKQVVLEELAQSEDQPEEVAFQRLLALACPGHPYGRPILGDRQALLDHDPQRMALFHQRRYRAENCSLAMAGAVGTLELERHVAASSLVALPAANDLIEDPGGAPFPSLHLQSGRHDLRLPRLEAARLLMVWEFPAAADLDAIAGADLLTTLLAEGKRSRLVQRLREDLRIVESIDLDLNVLEAGSLAMLEAVFEAEQADQVEAEIAKVLRELADQLPTEQELERARRLVSNGYRFGLESASSVAGLTGHQGLWGRLTPLNHPLELLAGWSVERLKEQMLPRLDPDLACRLLVLPA